MSFYKPTFLGCTVRSFTSSIGWGMGSPSQLNISLVEDPVNEDKFDTTDENIGQPYFFQYGDFKFNGLLQRVERTNAVDGHLYSATLVDPREILEGSPVIMGGYSGPTNSMPNLFNVYGYWESLGFGVSDFNQGGMTWVKVREALIQMTRNQSLYGGPFNYRGYRYNLDLSEVPLSPPFYRMGNTTHSTVLEIIAQICEDGGCDFFVELVGYTIKIRTVSRANQPPLGTIGNFIRQNIPTGIISRATNGLESRNEITSSFLVGGEMSIMYETGSLDQFWGFDFNGNPITSQSTQVSLKDNKGKVISRIDTDAMNLNSAPISDIIGSLSYPTTSLELRLVKSGYEAWATFLGSYRPEVARRCGVSPSLGNLSLLENSFGLSTDFVNDNIRQAISISENLVSGDGSANRSMRVYEFLKDYADEYMGRKYLVQLPFLVKKTDPETMEVTTSYEIADAGYHDENASPPLGLSTLNADFFSNTDGRYRCIGAYSGVIGKMDMSYLNQDSAVGQKKDLYVECQVDPQIIYQPTPCVQITFPSLIYQKSQETVGDLSLLAGVLRGDIASVYKALSSGYLDIRCQPDFVKPTAVAIPLKSNVHTYGPWYLAGASGKVNFEQDQSLVPWNYGGHSGMTMAGQAKILFSTTNMQVSETGALSVAGLPEISIGDVLQKGGPNMTGIDVNIEDQGVTTQYRFQTYTNRFGVFSKGSIERMQKLSLSQQQVRRNLRSITRDNITRQRIVNSAKATANYFQNAPKHIKKGSPHETIISFTQEDEETGVTRQLTQTATFQEAISLCNAHDDERYKNTAVMSLNGLFRPFSTNHEEAGLLPRYREPEVDGTNILNKTNLDPWGDSNDIEILAHKDSYEGLNVYQRRNGDFENARPISLRGPVIISGWGIGWDTKPVPGDGFDGDEFLEGYRYKQQFWRTGPLDVMWDNQRAVWTCHDIVMGVFKEDQEIESKGSGEILVKCGDDDNETEYTLNIFNGYSAPVSGKKDTTTVFAGYVATKNKWYIMSMDCEEEDE